MARSEKLLNIQPDELSFRFELMKEASCTIRLSSNSSRHVAFKVMTTSPEKYTVKPNFGILSPGSTRDLEVKMHAQKEAPPNMQCKDKFLIKSAVAGPDDTVEKSRKLNVCERGYLLVMETKLVSWFKLLTPDRFALWVILFNDRAHAVGNYKLGVVYVLPSHQQSSNLDRPGQGSLLNGSTLQERSLSGPEFQGRNGRLVDNMFVKGITILFLSLILLYLFVKILPVIWSWIFLGTILAIKMAKRLVSDSVEDWILKTLFYACIHFFTVVFRRKNSRSKSNQESRVSVVR